MTPREAAEVGEGMIAELKRARLGSGLRGIEVARRAGLERLVVEKSEYGLSQPRLKSLILWADALGYDLRLVKQDLSPEPE